MCNVQLPVEVLQTRDTKTFNRVTLLQHLLLRPALANVLHQCRKQQYVTCCKLCKGSLAVRRHLKAACYLTSHCRSLCASMPCSLGLAVDLRMAKP